MAFRCDKFSGPGDGTELPSSALLLTRTTCLINKRKYDKQERLEDNPAQIGFESFLASQPGVALLVCLQIIVLPHVWPKGLVLADTGLFNPNHDGRNPKIRGVPGSTSSQGTRLAICTCRQFLPELYLNEAAEAERSNCKDNKKSVQE